MRAAWALLLACALGGAGAGGELWGGEGGARFHATSTVLLSAGDARGGELGYRLQAALAVRPLPLLPPPTATTTTTATATADTHDVLLHFTLESPQLMLRGKQPGADFLPRPSLWDDHPSSDFLALWSAGRITEVYLDSKDPPDVLNFKKALISLFQFQREEGERNETDVSGECEVQYEVASPLVVRKFKHRCLWEGAWDVDEDPGEGEEEGEGEWDSQPARTERRRVVRYELREAGGLGAAHADELLLLHAPAHAGPALKARAHTTLQRRQPAPPAPPPPPPAPAPLPAALAQFPALTPHALPLRAQDHVPLDADEEESLEAAVQRHRAALEERAAGTREAAAAALGLLPALRRAAAPRLAALLARPDTHDIMEGLARALGLAGATGAHAAAREAFQLGAAAPPRPELGREYLAALALAPRVDEAVVRDALKLGGGAGEHAPAALLAAAAAARRARPPAAAAQLQRELRDLALRSLANCKEESCSVPRLLALGQLRYGDAGALLAAAERGGGAAGLAALSALARAPLAARRAARRRLAALALRLSAPAALPVRAAALEQLAAGDGAPAGLAELTAALRAHGPRELRRVCWQTLLARDPPVPEHLLAALDPRPRDWAKRAHDGTSVVLERELGPLRLRTVQLAERGVLRRGLVGIQLGARPLLTVEIWARGLESLSAAAPGPPLAAREPEDEPGAEPEPEDVAAGLALSVAGASRPDTVLFDSQGALLGHVWAGTGSSPTPVLRALLARAAGAARALAAGVLLHCSADTAVALKLDAQAVVSLWGRTARASLALRGAGVARRELAVRTAWGRVSARAHSHAAPALTVDAALDFYDTPQLCVHTAQPDYEYSHNVTLECEQGARLWLVRRTRVASRAVPGRTLALGAANKAACAALAHRDHA